MSHPREPETTEKPLRTGPNQPAVSRPPRNMEHILPKSRGGADSWMNLVTACKACNDQMEFLIQGVPKSSRIHLGGRGALFYSPRVDHIP